MSMTFSHDDFDKRLDVDEKTDTMADNVQDAAADAKKNVKNAWEDVKAGAKKAKNNAEAEMDKLND